MGRLASPVPAHLRETETVFEALSRLRADSASERSRYFYVTDSHDRLVGVAPARRLLFADPCSLVGEVMSHPVYSLDGRDTFGCAFALLAELRLRALPVVDDCGRLSGVIDVSGLTHKLVEMERKGLTPDTTWERPRRRPLAAWARSLGQLLWPRSS